MFRLRKGYVGIKKIEKLTEKELLEEMKILYKNRKQFAHLIGSYFELKRASKIHNTLGNEKIF